VGGCGVLCGGVGWVGGGGGGARERDESARVWGQDT